MIIVVVGFDVLVRSACDSWLLLPLLSTSPSWLLKTITLGVSSTQNASEVVKATLDVNMMDRKSVPTHTIQNFGLERNQNELVSLRLSCSILDGLALMDLSAARSTSLWTDSLTYVSWFGRVDGQRALLVGCPCLCMRLSENSSFVLCGRKSRCDLREVDRGKKVLVCGHFTSLVGSSNKYSN